MKSAALRWAKNLLPWLVAAGLFAYLFYKIPPAQVWNGLKYVNPWAFGAFSLFYFLLVMTLDNFALAKVLSRFESPVSFRELLPARCVSYLLSIVNYNAGQAAIALYFKKTRGLSFFKTLGVILFIAVTDLYWIIALAFASSFFVTLSGHGVVVQHWVQRVGYIALAGLLLHSLFWSGWLERLVPRKIHFGFFDWVRGRHIFQPFHHATFIDYVKIALYRLPIHLTIILSMGLVVRLFQASLSWLEVIATFPIVFLLGAIPLTPGGLGATQLATVELLKDRISSPLIANGLAKPEELLLAMSIAWMFVNYLCKALAGLVFLRTTKRQLEKPDPEPHNATH